MIFEFTDINRGPRNIDPMIAIRVNGQEHWRGAVCHKIEISVSLQEQNRLEIEFVNKTHRDTKVNEHGNIVDDMNFVLSEIHAEDLAFQEQLWQGHYQAGDNSYPACLFFGPAGFYQLDFEAPILKWKLRCHFEKTGQDPDWEQDFNYYTNACQLLNQI